jgi:hypothetical protein
MFHSYVSLLKEIRISLEWELPRAVFVSMDMNSRYTNFEANLNDPITDNL